MRTILFGLAALALLVPSACKKGEESVPAAEAFGCVTTYEGEEMSCTEFDAALPEADRVAACTGAKLKQIQGRLVRRCRAEGRVARCDLPSERSTMFFYEDDPQKLKGSAIGCNARGGTFSQAPKG